MRGQKLARDEIAGEKAERRKTPVRSAADLDPADMYELNEAAAAAAAADDALGDVEEGAPTPSSEPRSPASRAMDMDD